MELIRRARVKLNYRHERSLIDEVRSNPARLTREFQSLSPTALLDHFRKRRQPSFLPGFEAAHDLKFSAAEVKQLNDAAIDIAKNHRWALLGFGSKDFGREIDWYRDPLSGRQWPGKVFHADIARWHNDGSDIRVLWELNRLGHCLTLARAYAATRNEQFAEEFFVQVESWYEQNPLGLGANWLCAMEVALRAMNLLGAFAILRTAPSLNEERLSLLLALFEQHGAHIRRNLEYSYIATGNHYLSDVVGLLWLGIMLPELELAGEWRDWAFKELLREMDKQVLPSGADYEASTGYHRFVLELFLYSFILCDANSLTIDYKYRTKLLQMIRYVRVYLRPDGAAPLFGDTDSGQALPILHRAADDHAYLLALGAVVFQDGSLKPPNLEAPPELSWILGDRAVMDFHRLHSPSSYGQASDGFPDAGIYLLRQEDLYLAFNASGAGGNGRGSHGHNDSLSIEVSACGVPFIVDPGSYVYTADLDERHRFRSTAYHSTLEIDGVEQNSTNRAVPFVIGDEAHPKVLRWETTKERDVLIAEHRGYKRLSSPVIHRRAVIFDKKVRWWLIEDELLGAGDHSVAARFHFDSGLRVELESQNLAVATRDQSGVRLLVFSFDSGADTTLEQNFVSRDYGSKQPSLSICWSRRVGCPAKFRWAIVPVCKGEDEGDRLSAVKDVANVRFEI
jgi:hypothetical protein